MTEPRPPVIAWPRPLGRRAFHGPAGAIVQELAPYTEADPVGMLAVLLAGCGNIIGPGPRFAGMGGLQPLLLYPVLVGETANGRKGTAQRLVGEVLGHADPAWFRHRHKGGLSTGEGLIWQVRDAGPDGDPGVEDKRLYLVEEEFARILRVAPREHNTLSMVVRVAWDGVQLSIITKHQPAVATRPHVTVVGHVTPKELRRYLTDTEMASGFANRFLWACVRRSRYLARGGSFPHERLIALARQLQVVLLEAASLRVLRFDAGAEDWWERVYPELTRRPPDLFGAITGRADAYVQRLAALYAALDVTEVVGVEHLRAALAVWQYGEDSVRAIFGNSSGDPVKDSVLEALRDRPRSTTELSNVFNRNLPQLGDVLEEMEEDGLIAMSAIATGGRPRKVWRLVADDAGEDGRG